MRKLKIVLKDIMTVLRREGEVKSGVYALLKADAKVDLAIPLIALYTDGAKGNDIPEGSFVQGVPAEFDPNQTRLLTTTQEGRDEVNDAEEKKMLSHYYALTNDKIVTRSDLKSFCIKELYKYDIGSVNRIEIANDDDTRTVVAFVSEVNPDLNLEAIQQRIERLIDVHGAGQMPVKILIVKQ